MSFLLPSRKTRLIQLFIGLAVWCTIWATESGLECINQLKLGDHKAAISSLWFGLGGVGSALILGGINYLVIVGFEGLPGEDRYPRTASQEEIETAHRMLYGDKRR
jgi:hypothetical protein